MSGWRLVVVSAALPPLVVALVSVAAMTARLAGTGLWSPEELTLAEAAVTGSLPDIERLIALGADPNRSSRVRGAFMRDGRDRFLAPLSAAELVGRPDAADLLRSLGAVESISP